MLHTNPRLELADQYVRYTNRHVFLTGKAGTGKTTFLKNLKKSSPKRMVIVAPTGVAAINAEGVTIHSFFQLPFGPFIPAANGTAEKRFEHKFSKEKIKAIKAMDLLVIDEISMVRADLLDAIDEVLRRYRVRNKPFGGVQLLMIGDLHQLAPVIKDDEWNLIKDHYASIYFFESIALKRSQLMTIELTKIYRQEDEIFIRLLNKVRDNQLDTESIDQLNSRYQPDFNPAEGPEYITLTTHNHAAQSINQTRLMELEGKLHSFKAEVVDDFPEHMYPNEFKLDLKVGAQVMFVKNDSNREKLFYNGKLGVITKIEEQNIHVRCQDDTATIVTSRVTWNNIKYVLDENKMLQEKLIGSFTQFPIKTAWAITIHKSQGLTFERAIIDAQSSFAHGQVYVALSRCKSFEGLVLSTPIGVRSVKSDGLITTFNDQSALQDLSEQSLKQAKKQSQAEWIKELFDFRTCQKNLYYLTRTVEPFADQLKGEATIQLNKLGPLLESDVKIIADKFLFQLDSYFNLDELPEEHAALQERIKKGSSFLYQKLTELVYTPLRSLDLECDNKETQKLISKSYEVTLRSLIEKQKLLEICQDGFDSIKYLQTKANISIDADTLVIPKKPKGVSYAVNRTAEGNPDLYEIIKQWRDQIANEKNVPQYMVLPQKTIKYLCDELPGNIAALSKINGLGKVKLDLYGDQLLRIIHDYGDSKGLQTTEVHDVVVEKPKFVKGATQQATYDMFKSGKTIEEISKERGLGISTIEGHLARYISKGLIKLTDIMPSEKAETLSAYMSLHPSLTHKELKETFGDKYTYGDIQLVAASLGVEDR